MIHESAHVPAGMESSKSNPESFWHQGPVLYQIYPRSFNATEASPEGTLKGITEKLPYLKNTLGVDAIWLTPPYESAMVDGGYDVISYREIDSRFGTMDDFKELIDKAHEHELKVMVDFVPNHMSTQSEWYKEALSSKGSPKSDWFIFRDLNPDGSLPNNWPSEFRHTEIDPTTGQEVQATSSVWQYVPERDQYVMCTFTPGQVDLNWHNPEVREAMKNEMRFLLDKGVDAFRVDMVTYIGKNPALTDEPLNPDYDPTTRNERDKLLRKYRNGDDSVYEYINEIIAVLDEYDDTFMVTEDYVPRDDPLGGYLKYYKNTGPRKCAPFSFENLEIMMPRTAIAHKTFYDSFMLSMEEDFVPTGVLGNHDQSRVVSSIGEAAARAAAVQQMTLPGMPFVYYGEELGMADVPIPADKIDDPYDNRDPERTPMLWTSDAYAGFSTVEPWLPVSPDYKEKNIQAQLSDPHSFLSLYRRLIQLRHDSMALKTGTYAQVDSGHDDVFGFRREHGEENLLILTNFSNAKVVAKLPGYMGDVVLNSIDAELGNNETIDLEDLTLRPNEGTIIRLRED